MRMPSKKALGQKFLYNVKIILIPSLDYVGIKRIMFMGGTYMRRIIFTKNSKKNNKGALARNIVNVVAIVLIASTAITWIGVMEINKK